MKGCNLSHCYWNGIEKNHAGQPSTCGMPHTWAFCVHSVCCMWLNALVACSLTFKSFQERSHSWETSLWPWDSSYWGLSDLEMHSSISLNNWLRLFSSGPPAVPRKSNIQVQQLEAVRSCIDIKLRITEEICKSRWVNQAEHGELCCHWSSRNCRLSAVVSGQPHHKPSSWVAAVAFLRFGRWNKAHSLYGCQDAKGCLGLPYWCHGSALSQQNNLYWL